jgi:uncharacterized protein (TIGR03435 family)
MMLRVAARLACAALLTIAAFSQTTDGGAKFEAADVHASPKVRNPFLNGPFLRGNRYEIHFATVLDLVAEAYGMDSNDVFGGPAWLEMKQFDLIAKVPEHTKHTETREMLRELLAERFHLVVHKDTKPMPAYAITAPGKHPNLKEAAEGAEKGCKGDLSRVEPPATQMFVYTCTSKSMADLVGDLRNNMPMSDRVFYNRPVLDQTELKGEFEFTLRYSLMARPGADPSTLVSLQDALEKQLGLKIESVKAPLPVLNLEKVDPQPTPNVPGVAKILGMEDGPPEFEVASIKASDPDFKGVRFNVLPSGQVNIQGASLKFLVTQLHNFSDDMVLDAPKSMDDRWDIVAKAPKSAMVVFTGSNNGPPRPTLDFQTAIAMLDKLLAERFNLKMHMEERMINAYVLSAGKPKMKAADPAARTRYHEGPATADPKADPRNKAPMLSRLVTVENMTMAQFAEKLQDIAPGYIHSPVLDTTGLTGSYDFTLSFSPAGAFQGGGGRDGAGAAPRPSGDDVADPSGAVTLPEAIDKQLGLKLEQKKRMVQVLVIDHVEAKPTEN